MKNKLLLIAAGLILLLFLGLNFKNKYTNTSNKVSNLKITPTPSLNVMTNISQEQLQQYYDTYKRPYVIHVRKALDAYLANDSSKACIMNIAVTPRTDSGIVTGLDSFGEDYYISKFVVLTVDDSKYFESAKDIQIMFQDKPDRIFYALVGLDPLNKNSKEYCLLGFNSKENIDKESLQNAVEFYRPLLFDKEHSL